MQTDRPPPLVAPPTVRTMAFYDFTITNVCKNLDWVDITRLLIVNKTLNMLVKQHATSISTPYHPRYSQFTGLKTIIYTSGPAKLLPSNITKLILAKKYRGDMPISNTVTSLTINHVRVNFPHDMQTVLPNLTALDVIKSPIKLSCDHELTNIQDLRAKIAMPTASFPQNLTTTSIDEEDVNNIKSLPHTLTELVMYSGISDIHARDLPSSLKKLTCYAKRYMKSNDYFNSELEILETNFWNNESSCFNSRMIPASLTSLNTIISNIDSVDFVKALPRSLLHLEITAARVDEEFYQNLPSNLLSLAVNAYPTCNAYVYPSLLPRTLTSLRSKDGGHLVVTNDVDFPPNIQYIHDIIIQDEELCDLSKLVHLHTLYVESSKTTVLPSNLSCFQACVHHIDLPKHLTTYNCAVMLLSEIKDLPRSLQRLWVNTLYVDVEDNPNFPPNLELFKYNYFSNDQMSYDQLLYLPNTMCYFDGDDNYKLVRTIDGNKFIKKR